ncbi:MAG: hypothetical protein MPJ08_03730 [Nitrosopumilus sp.]|nr:hypothetical protein [Nitrosopumilus sp.]
MLGGIGAGAALLAGIAVLAGWSVTDAGAELGTFSAALPVQLEEFDDSGFGVVYVEQDPSPGPEPVEGQFEGRIRAIEVVNDTGVGTDIDIDAFRELRIAERFIRYNPDYEDRIWGAGERTTHELSSGTKSVVLTYGQDGKLLEKKYTCTRDDGSVVEFTRKLLSTIARGCPGIPKAAVLEEISQTRPVSTFMAEFDGYTQEISGSGGLWEYSITDGQRTMEMTYVPGLDDPTKGIRDGLFTCTGPGGHLGSFDSKFQRRILDDCRKLAVPVLDMAPAAEHPHEEPPAWAAARADSDPKVSLFRETYPDHRTVYHTPDNASQAVVLTSGRASLEAVIHEDRLRDIRFKCFDAEGTGWYFERNTLPRILAGCADEAGVALSGEAQRARLGSISFSTTGVRVYHEGSPGFTVSVQIWSFDPADEERRGASIRVLDAGGDAVHSSEVPHGDIGEDGRFDVTVRSDVTWTEPGTYQLEVSYKDRSATHEFEYVPLDEVPQLDWFTISKAHITDASGTALDHVVAGEPASVAAKITNNLDKDRKFFLLVRINGTDGAPQEPLSETGRLPAGQSVDASLEWTPESVGTYEMVLHVRPTADGIAELAHPLAFSVVVLDERPVIPAECATGMMLVDGVCKDVVYTGVDPMINPEPEPVPVKTGVPSEEPDVGCIEGTELVDGACVEKSRLRNYDNVDEAVLTAARATAEYRAYVEENPSYLESLSDYDGYYRYRVHTEDSSLLFDINYDGSIQFLAYYCNADDGYELAYHNNRVEAIRAGCSYDVKPDHFEIIPFYDALAANPRNSTAYVAYTAHNPVHSEHMIDYETTYVFLVSGDSDGIQFHLGLDGQIIDHFYYCHHSDGMSTARADIEGAIINGCSGG